MPNASPTTLPPPPPPPSAPPRPGGGAATPGRSRPRRRHPAARSRALTGIVSVLAFLGLGGAMAARATQATPARAAGSGGSTTARSGSTDQQGSSSLDPWSGAEPSAPIVGQTPIGSSGGS